MKIVIDTDDIYTAADLVEGASESHVVTWRKLDENGRRRNAGAGVKCKFVTVEMNPEEEKFLGERLQRFRRLR
jgi:hypothetical protein